MDDSVATLSDSFVDYYKYRLVDYQGTVILLREVIDFICFDRFTCDFRMRHLRSSNLGYEGVLGLAQPDGNIIFEEEDTVEIYNENDSGDTLQSILSDIDSDTFSTRFSSGEADSWVDLQAADESESIG